MEERKYKVYMHTNTVNGKRYVGITRQSLQNRWRKGLGYRSQQYFYRAIKKYTWDAFEHELLLCNLTGKEAEEIEKSIIKAFELNNPKKGYNFSEGGACTREMTEETRNKIKRNHADVSGKNNPMYGIHPWCYNKGRAIICIDNDVVYKNARDAAEKTRLKEGNIRCVLSGKQKSTGGLRFVYLDKYDENKWYNPDIGNVKGIICTDTMKVFKSAKECAEKLELDASSILKVCKGKYKHTKGYHFQYWQGQEIQKTTKLQVNITVSIKCLNNGKIYNSIRSAAQELNLDPSSISKVCRKKISQIKGHKFEYVTS